VRLCDAFFGAGSSTTAVFADAVTAARAELAAAGRRTGFGPGGFPVAKRVYVGIGPQGAARERMNAALAAVYGRRVPAEIIPALG
jgi:hypothetical protein